MIPRLVATGLVILFICGVLWYYTRSWSDFWRALCTVVFGVLSVVLFIMFILLIAGMITVGLWPWDPQFWEAGS